MTTKSEKPSKKNGKTSKSKADEKKIAGKKTESTTKKSAKQTKNSIKKVEKTKKSTIMENTEKTVEETTAPVVEGNELDNTANTPQTGDSVDTNEKNDTSKLGKENKKEKKYDFERKFEIVGKAEFLGGIVKLGSDNSIVYIRRTEPFRFEFTGLMTDNKTDYTFPFDCEEDEADIFWNELVKYEKDLAKQKKNEGNKKSEPAKKETVDSQKNPSESQNLNTPQNFTIPKAENFDHNTITMKRLTEYGTSIADTIKNSIQARIHGGMPHSEALKVLAACSKEFTYSIGHDANGKYITISQGSITTRTEYLPIL